MAEKPDIIKKLEELNNELASYIKGRKSDLFYAALYASTSTYVNHWKDIYIIDDKQRSAIESFVMNLQIYVNYARLREERRVKKKTLKNKYEVIGRISFAKTKR